MLWDAKNWAKMYPGELVAGEERLIADLKQQVVHKKWNDFLPRHHFSDFRLGYEEFGKAMWSEGWPSLEDFTAIATASAVERDSWLASERLGGGAVEFSPEHRKEFAELSSTGVHLYATNRHPDKSSFGPWLLPD